MAHPKYCHEQRVARQAMRARVADDHERALLEERIRKMAKEKARVPLQGRDHYPDIFPSLAPILNDEVKVESYGKGAPNLVGTALFNC